MHGLIVIDPSLRSLGWAVFAAGELVGGGVASAPPAARDLDAWGPMGVEVAQATWARLIASGTPQRLELVGERPQVYRGGKAAPDDLLQLAGVLGGVAAGLGSLRPVDKTWAPTPREWKGNRDKATTQRAAEGALTPAERATISEDLGRIPAPQHNDVWDAVALGLRYLHRIR